MSKHTPGPWTVQPRANNMIDVCHNNRDEPGAITLALCRVQARDSWIDEAHANANLIAAAPELLDALTNLCGLAKKRPGSLFEYKAAVDSARAAIAKATGAA